MFKSNRIRKYLHFSFCQAAMAFLFFTVPAAGQAAGQTFSGEVPVPTAMQAAQTPNGLAASNNREVLEVTVCGDSLIHVAARPMDAPASTAARPWMLDPAVFCPGATFQFNQTGDKATLTTARMAISLSLKRGNLSFGFPQGESFLRENFNLPRTYYSAPGQPGSLYRIQDRFSPDSSEAIYGLGQHQSGLFNYRGSTVELGQNNTDVAIPLLVSSKGYAILWNTASFSYMDNRFPLDLSFESMAADQVDYYVLYGPEMDKIIHQYRSMTGHTPLLPQWAYGLFQSRDRYNSQAEILEIASQYRARHIPLDAIVQDWFWWKQGGEGDPEFNANYSDVPTELKTLHDEHIHAMISVWGMMDPSSKTFQEIQRQGFEIPGTHVYDATNPEARDLYWNRLPGKLFAQGWDAFWLDSAEPEEYWPHGGDAVLRYKQLHIGSGLEYTNIFPLEHTLGVQEIWKQTNPEKRVFLLTRSAFIGQQRVGATVWSGDVYGSWWGLHHQIAAGLNFALSGYPYWTTDIGGYWSPYDHFDGNPAYQELYARWFEYGVFCPVFRTHGHRAQNEMWVYDRVYPTLLAFDRLRYRLLPYIYSLAWKVTSEDATIQRPLVMDFREDRATWEIGDEFLFGPEILVSPVIREHTTQRAVYLPAGSDWYDFWTGERVTGGVEVNQAAPIERIPLNLRAGSILPLGPAIEYTGQAADPIELRIYPGANGDFNLYEDEGDSYRYEKGAHSIIPLHWDDAARTLTIGAREGSYPGMNPGHIFNVVIVAAGHGAGAEPVQTPDKAIQYTGEKIEVKF
ncbi:MAG TPA: TIM-barrel domain-containing protein [Terracidiphilus sp.]|jgi:alpha-D-xyloside xylohydrolase